MPEDHSENVFQDPLTLCDAVLHSVTLWASSVEDFQHQLCHTVQCTL